MGIVIGALVGVLVIVVVVWLAALVIARRAELRQARLAQADAEQVQRLMDRDARMRSSAMLLRCTSCDRTFPGPLSDETGCPGCHTTAFVIPDSDYRQTLSNIRS